MVTFNRSAVRCGMQSPWGPLTLAAHATALIGVWFDGQKHGPDISAWPLSNQHPVLETAVQQLQQYFAGERRGFDLPLDLSSGTPFQQRVWHALLTIAPGDTVSYGTISQRIGQPGAMRAVGGAVARNPIGIVVPCHRVVGSNGAMTGFAGGLDRKVALLQLESSH